MKLIPNFFTSLFIDETYTYTCLLDYSLNHVRLSLFFAFVFILSLVCFIFYPGVHPEVDKGIDTGMRQGKEEKHCVDVTHQLPRRSIYYLKAPI